jgi:hypothetical protein
MTQNIPIENIGKDRFVKTRICIKNTFFKEKLFTTEVQGILKGAWLVRRF